MLACCLHSGWSTAGLVYCGLQCVYHHRVPTYSGHFSLDLALLHGMMRHQPKWTIVQYMWCICSIQLSSLGYNDKWSTYACIKIIVTDDCAVVTGDSKYVVMNQQHQNKVQFLLIIEVKVQFRLSRTELHFNLNQNCIIILMLFITIKFIVTCRSQVTTVLS